MEFKFRESPLPLVCFRPFIEGQDLERTDRCTLGGEIMLETIASEVIKVRDYIFDKVNDKYIANHNGVRITFEHGQVQKCTRIYSPTKTPKSLEGTR